MLCAIKLSLGDFGRAAVEDCAKGHGREQSELVRSAFLHYLGQVESGRAAVAFPQLRRPARFARGSGKSAALELSVDLDGGQWDSLEANAKREGVALEALLAHAVLLFLADLDAGRAVLGT